MMLKRTLACLFIVAAFPLLASPSHNNFANSVPFASIAFAGHSLMGGYACACGCPGCICDTGEISVECGQENMAISDKTNQIDSPVGADTASGFDFGSSALMIALAFFVWARFLRA